MIWFYVGVKIYTQCITQAWVIFHWYFAVTEFKTSFGSVDDCLEENIYPSHGIAVVVASVEA